MKTYGDTSFLVKLLTRETGSEEAMAQFRRLGFPRLFYLPPHALEVENAIRQRLFHLRGTANKKERNSINGERDSALERVDKWVARRWLVESSADLDSAFHRARKLSERHTERLGSRGFDLFHVALAMELECETFLTADVAQGNLARAGGLTVILSQSG